MAVPDGIGSTYTDGDDAPEEAEEDGAPLAIGTYHTDPKLTDAEKRRQEGAESEAETGSADEE